MQKSFSLPLPSEGQLNFQIIPHIKRKSPLTDLIVQLCQIIIRVLENSFINPLKKQFKDNLCEDL